MPLDLQPVEYGQTALLEPEPEPIEQRAKNIASIAVNNGLSLQDAENQYISDNQIKYSLSNETGRDLLIGTLNLSSGLLASLKKRGMQFMGGGVVSPEWDRMLRKQWELVKPEKQVRNLVPSPFPLEKRKGGAGMEALGLVTRLPEAGRMIAANAAAAQMERLQPVTFKDHPVIRLLRPVLQNVPSYSVAIGLGVLTQDPLLSLGILGESEGGQSFQMQLEAGGSLKKAMMISELSEAAEIGGEMLVLPKFIKGITEGIPLQRAIVLVAENATQEGLTGFTQQFLETFGIEHSKGTSLREAATKAFEEGIKAIPENAWVGGALAGAPAAVSAVVNRAKAGQERLVVSRAREVETPTAETLRTEPRETIVQQEQKSRMFTLLEQELQPESAPQLSKGYLTKEEYDALGDDIKKKIAAIGNPQLVQLPPEEAAREQPVLTALAEKEAWEMTKEEYIAAHPEVLKKEPWEMEWIEQEKIYVQGKLAQSKEFQEALKQFEITSDAARINTIPSKQRALDLAEKKASRKVSELDKEADIEITKLVRESKESKEAYKKLEEYKGEKWADEALAKVEKPKLLIREIGTRDRVRILNSIKESKSFGRYDFAINENGSVDVYNAVTSRKIGEIDERGNIVEGKIEDFKKSLDKEIQKRISQEELETLKQRPLLNAERIKQLENFIAKEKPAEVLPEKTAETRDILGGLDPIMTITESLRKARKVTKEIQREQVEERKRRVATAAGTLEWLKEKKGVASKEAMERSTGMLRGPLTEYKQKYESMADKLEPETLNAAYDKIADSDLQYFEKLNLKTAFEKLVDGAYLTPREANLISDFFGADMGREASKRIPYRSYKVLINFWKAGLLTGIKTSGLNTFSNMFHGVSEVVKDVPASAIDTVISYKTGKRTMGLTTRGSATGIKEGAIKGWDYLKTGHDQRDVAAKYDYVRINMDGSNFAKFTQAYEDAIFRLMGAEDQPFYYGAKARSLESQAIAQAKNEGLTGDEASQFIKSLLENPTDEMMKYAVLDAETAVFQNRTMLGDIGRMMQKVPGGEVIVPFSRTPSAVAMQIINYSPFGATKAIFENAQRGKFDQRIFSQQIGRSLTGTAVLALGMALYKAGMIALDRPRNEREQKLWELEGRKPNAIKIGGKWRDVQVLGPAGNLLVIGGHFVRALDEKGSPTEAIVTAVSGGAKSFTEQTFVRGINMAVDAITDPERSFEVFFTSLAGSTVPTIISDIARATDTTERVSKGPVQRIKSRIPGLRETLEPRLDVFGNDLPRYGGNPIEVMLDPTRPFKIRQDVVVDELRRLWDKGIKVSPTMLSTKYGYESLTQEENTMLWHRAGELTYFGLYDLIHDSKYLSSDDEQKGKLIEKAVKEAKDFARAEMAERKIYAGETKEKLIESGLLTKTLSKKIR